MSTPRTGSAPWATGRRPASTLEDMVDTLAKMPLVFSPGTRWNYSVSTDVLGHLIELISGQTLDAYLKQHLLEPLGMRDTGFVIADSHAALRRQLRAPGRRPPQDDRRPRGQPVPPGELSSVAAGSSRRPTTTTASPPCCSTAATRRQAPARAEDRRADDDQSPARRRGPHRARRGGSFTETAYAGVGFGLGFSVNSRRRGRRCSARRASTPGAAREHGVLDRPGGGLDRHLHDAAHAVVLVPAAP